MSTLTQLYQKVILNSSTSQVIPTTKTYKGFSTVSNETSGFSLYDLSLIKQDLINHFHIRKGERLENPEFGTIIWDLLFEPLTEEVKQLIAADVSQVINYDPRISSNEIIVTSYETGIIVECSVTYMPYYITEQLKFSFDQSNNIAVSN